MAMSAAILVHSVTQGMRPARVVAVYMTSRDNFFCCSWVKNEATWLPLEGVKFEILKSSTVPNIDRTSTKPANGNVNFAYFQRLISSQLASCLRSALWQTTCSCSMVSKTQK